MATAPRLDLEARLRALRAPKPSPPTSAASAHEDADYVIVSRESEAAISWPEVPTQPDAHDVASWPEPPKLPDPGDVASWPEPPKLPDPGDVASWPEPPRPKRTPPPVVIMRRASDVEAVPLTRQQRPVSPPPQAKPMDAAEVSRLLGPDYEHAVQVAQYAIQNERQRYVHTAIRAYIEAGELLIEIGRRQAAPHLQNIVKTKALALLQRAEGLSDWAHQILAVDSSETALTRAFEHSRITDEQQMSEKEAMVSKIQSDNHEMSNKLSQLTGLLKARQLFRRALSAHRERKAQKKENARRNSSASMYNDARDSVGSESRSSIMEDSEEDIDEFRSSQTDPQDSPREAQKRAIVNELHAKIGLPEINHLRTFRPLHADNRAEARQEELEQELERARQEAEKLRAAVSEMEECLRAAAQHSKQRSIKLEKQKEEDISKVQSELDRVRRELENERRLFASFESNRSSTAFEDDEDRQRASTDPDAYENSAMIDTLRSSLQSLDSNSSSFNGRSRKASRDARNISADYDESPQVRRMSQSHNSPRRKTMHQWEARHMQEDNDTDDDLSEDGGVWL